MGRSTLETSMARMSAIWGPLTSERLVSQLHSGVGAVLRWPDRRVDRPAVLPSSGPRSVDLNSGPLPDGLAA